MIPIPSAQSVINILPEVYAAVTGRSNLNIVILNLKYVLRIGNFGITQV